MTHEGLEKLIEDLFANPAETRDVDATRTVNEVIDLLDHGEIRVAEKTGDTWIVNQWVKKAILLLFRHGEMATTELGPFEYHDKIPLKRNYADLKVRVVPPGAARYGSYLAPGVVLMPSYVNIGAHVGSGTMVDTWATVGSCAQIGSDVHLSGGVGIGGVLEPLQANPVIVEDGAFIGSRCIVVEGTIVGEQAVLGANVTITGSTRIIDVTGTDTAEYRGYVPPRSIVIPGTRTKDFPAGSYGVPVALIIGQRKPSTDLKVSLNEALRDHNVAV
ncbi:MAG: 2,3,4,5-tetrahydropyridine-2,6-dicarboxylate N-succinyltransferase [Actinomycetota bacterium]